MGLKGLSTLTPGGGGVPLSRGSDFQGGAFSASRPLRIRQVLPSYPQNARIAGVEGVTLLKVEVLPDGRVGKVLLEASSGNADLDRVAQAAVFQWRFSPARQGDRRIKCWVKIPIRFRLAGG